MSNSNGRRDARRKKGMGPIEAGGKKKEYEDLVKVTNASIEEKGNDLANKQHDTDALPLAQHKRFPFFVWNTSLSNYISLFEPYVKKLDSRYTVGKDSQEERGIANEQHDAVLHPHAQSKHFPYVNWKASLFKYISIFGAYFEVSFREQPRKG